MPFGVALLDCSSKNRVWVRLGGGRLLGVSLGWICAFPSLQPRADMEFIATGSTQAGLGFAAL